jgi:hypothetical protein
MFTKEVQEAGEKFTSHSAKIGEDDQVILYNVMADPIESILARTRGTPLMDLYLDALAFVVACRRHGLEPFVALKGFPAYRQRFAD